MQPQIAINMNTPTDQIFRLVYTPERIQLKRMLITDITITQDAPYILYQVPFELTKSPSRAWKEVLMESWQSVIRHKGRVSETVIWVFHNRILINKVPIDLVRDELETLVATAVEKTNRQIKLRPQRAI